MDLQLEELDLCLKLVNEVEQRWSSAIKVLKRVLTLWDVLSTHYRDNEHKTFPLASYKTILIELYSLVAPVQDVIISAQGNKPTGVKCMLSLVTLFMGVLHPHEPLPVLWKDGAAVQAEDAVKRSATDLAAGTTFTRAVLRQELSKRYFAPMYGVSTPQVCIPKAHFIRTVCASACNKMRVPLRILLMHFVTIALFMCCLLYACT